MVEPGKSTPRGSAGSRGETKRTAKATRSQESKAEDIRQKIEQAAYLKAEENQFQGDPVDYWLAAEAELQESTGKKN